MTNSNTGTNVRTSYDLDKLTNKELSNLGLNSRKFAKSQKDICSLCGRETSQPITRYNFHGVEMLKEGEKAHKGCIIREINNILSALKGGLL